MTFVALFCRTLIGLIFLVSAGHKILSRQRLRDFTSWIAVLPLPTRRLGRLSAVVVVSAEILIVLLIALPATAAIGLIVAAVTLAVFATATVVLLRKGTRTPCLCFGPSDTPLRVRHAIRDLLLLAVAIAGALGAGLTPPPTAGVLLCTTTAFVTAFLVSAFDDIAGLLLSPSGSSLPSRIGE